MKTTSTLDDAHVYFADQKIERPQETFATVRIDGPIALGAVDPITRYQDLTRPNGQEIELRVEGVRELVVAVQVWAAPTVAGGAGVLVSPLVLPLGGGDSAVAIASQILTGLRLPSVRDALLDVGLAPFATGPVTNLGRLLGTAFDGRASFETRFYWTETVSEYSGYVNRVEVVNNDTGDTIVVE